MSSVRRPPFSVIVLAGGNPTEFRACLGALRPTLGVRDELLCVVPPGGDDLRRVAADGGRVSVVDGDGRQPWPAGLAAAGHDLAVLVDGDVFVSPHWLDALGRAFAADPAVVAAGPRCHRTYGPQRADLPVAAVRRPADFAAYARTWRQDHRDRTRPVDRLGPVCVAVRRDALAAAGGPGLDLPYDGLAARGTLLVVEEALVAHLDAARCGLRAAAGEPGAARTGSPRITGCLIVKDEAEVLADCLIALDRYVDEIVVYDTGSADRTREIAREHGARVVDGYWTDHFGDARNRALAHCTGDWIFAVDADEVVTGDPAALRRAVGDARQTVYRVGQENAYGHGQTLGANTILYPRLFRRDTGRYAGRLHEQVVDRITGTPLSGPRWTG